jgi:hypothetical protein
MADTPNDAGRTNENRPADSHPEPAWRIDEDGNIRGVIWTHQVDHFVEFVDQAVILTDDQPGPESGP